MSHPSTCSRPDSPRASRDVRRARLRHSRGLDTSNTNGWTRYHPKLTLRDVFDQALTVVGAERLLFGTDSSFFPRGWQDAIHVQQRAVLGELGLAEHAVARIMGGNFNRLFPLADDAQAPGADSEFSLPTVPSGLPSFAPSRGTTPGHREVRSAVPVRDDGATERVLAGTAGDAVRIDRVRQSFLVLVLVCAFTFFLGLGRPAITDSDEAFYAEAGREMVESGDLLTPRYNYANRFQKPVLFYWFVAGGFWLTGVDAAAARAPAALSGLGLVLLAYVGGRRWFGEPTGRLAGLLVATSAGCAAVARLSLPDLPLAFFMTLTIVLGVGGLLEQGAPRLGWLAGASAAAGAAFLTKGPVGVAVPALVLVPLVVIERRWAALRPGPIALALVVFTLVAAPWDVAMTAEHCTTVPPRVLRRRQPGALCDRPVQRPRPAWFYLPVVVAGLLPWSPFLLLWVRPLWQVLRRQRTPSPEIVRLMVWAGLPLLLFTVSVGKQPRYILPVLPPLAIALARSIRGPLTSLAPAGVRGARACGAGAGALVAALGIALLVLPENVLGESAAWLTPAGIGGIVAGAAGMIAAWFQPRWIPPVVAAGGVVLVLGVQYGLLSATGPETVEQVAAHVRAHVAAGARWTTHDVFVRNLVFYVASPQSGPFDDAGLVGFLQLPEPVVCVVSERDWRGLRRRYPSRFIGSGNGATSTWLRFAPASCSIPSPSVRFARSFSCPTERPWLRQGPTDVRRPSASGALAILVAVAFVGVNLVNALRKGGDFAVYLEAGRRLVEGARLYEGSAPGSGVIGPPFQALVFAPFSLIADVNLALARLAWYALNLVLLGLAIDWWRAACRPSSPW